MNRASIDDFRAKFHAAHLALAMPKHGPLERVKDRSAAAASSLQAETRAFRPLNTGEGKAKAD